MKTKAFLALLLSLCIFPPALAQTKLATQPQSDKSTDDRDDVVRITTNLVQVDAVVTKNGKPVKDLTADDFEIYEDGRRQTVTSFAYISNGPKASSQPSTAAHGKSADAPPFPPLRPDEPRRTIALVVDDLGMSAESMGWVKPQLRKFVAERLQPNDLVAIIRTGGEVGALQQFTNDRRLLNRAVDRLRWNLCSRMGFSVLPSLGSGRFLRPSCVKQSYSQTMKALRFILDAMGQLPGRKSMVLLSDHLPQETQEIDSDESPARFGSFRNYSKLLQKIAEKAIRSSVVIYSVDTQGLQYTGLTAADSVRDSGGELSTKLSSVMADRSELIFSRRVGGELIARQTGGFQVRNSNSLKLDRIMEDQSGYYLVGYRPNEETFNRRFHRIKAKIKRPGMTVRTRYGFFGLTEEEANQSRRPYINATNLALIYPFRAQHIELDLTSFFVNEKTEGSIVRSFLYIDGKNVTLDEVNGRREGAITVYGVIFGDNGAVVEQGSRHVNLRLSESDYARAIRDGMSAYFDMSVKRPGSYQVRVVVRDKKSSRIGSAGQFVEVPKLTDKRLAVSGIVLGDVAESSGSASEPSQSMINPGVKRFQPNSDFYFTYAIYNAVRGSATSLPNLSMEIRLFRDGKTVYYGSEIPIEIANQPDPTRVVAHGMVPLKDLEPGSYYLQVVIADKNAKKNTVPVVQWADFEIVK